MKSIFFGISFLVIPETIREKKPISLSHLITLFKRYSQRVQKKGRK